MVQALEDGVITGAVEEDGEEGACSVRLSGVMPDESGPWEQSQMDPFESFDC
jgi:hypothetical protein